MADQKTPLDAHAIELVKALAVEAAGASLLNVTTGGLGDGLPASVPFLFDRKGQVSRSLKPLVEEFRLAPARRKGIAHVDTLASFIALTDRHKDEQSALFGKTSWPDPKLTAVLNYDSAEAPARFGDHRIEYSFPGEIRSVYSTRRGLTRVVVEATGEAYAGMQHIFSPDQLRRAEAEVPA